MKKISILSILAMAFCVNSYAQSITLSPSNILPFTVKTGGSGAGFYGDIGTSAASGFQYYYVGSTTSSLGTTAGNIFGSNSRFGMNSNTSLILRTNSLDRVTILNDGKVGVGASTPTAPLDVLGQDNWNLGGGSNGDFRVGTNAYNFRIGVAQGGGGAGIVRLYGNALILGGNGQDKVVINTNGLSVCPTSLYFPTYALETHPNAGNYALGIYSPNNAHRWEHFVSDGGGMSLYADNIYVGGFNLTTGAYTSISDITFKKNIASLGSVMNNVLNLKASTYEYKDNNPNNRQTTGLIAQDLQVLFPQFVYKNTDKDGSEVLSVDYAGLSVIALKAIQEQQVMILQLQADIKALKNK